MTCCKDVKPQTQRLFDASLLRGLVCTVDGIRQIATDLGARPYRVFMIHTRWEEARRGMNQEFIVEETELLPTPLVESLDALDDVLEAVGTIETGSLQVTQVSASHTADVLMGRDRDGAVVAESDQFFWEVAYLNQSPDGGDRRRFTPKNPVYDATGVQWTITLERAVGDRARDGVLHA